MASPEGKTPEPDDPHDGQSNDSVQPSMTIHPVNYSGMPMHMYPFPPGLVPTSQPLRSKRRQVKNACTNCQKACKKCDDARPCLRCVKYGIAEECVDSQRKERKKGIKRGPYKKRDGKGSSVEQIDVPVQQGMTMPNGMPPAPSSPPVAPYMGPVMYPPGFYGQYPAPPGVKPGEGHPYMPQIYIPMPPPPQHGGQEGENQGYPPHASFFPFMPYHQFPPYMMHPHPRQDGQMPIPGHPYAGYGHPYPKPPSAGSSNDAGAGPSGKGAEAQENGDGQSG